MSAALVGCIGATDGDEIDPASAGDLETAAFIPDVPEFDFTDAIDADHADHHVPVLHEQAFGLSQLGHTNFEGTYGPAIQGGWSEVDVHGNLAAVGSMTGFNGITLVDVSDPANPTPLSFIISAGDDWDARFSDDGTYLFFGCQVGQIVGTIANVAGDCAGNTMPHAPGAEHADGNHVVAYDVSDPANPELAGIVDTIGAHNVYTATIDGEYYVFTDGTDIIHFDPTKGSADALQVVAEVGGVHDIMVAQHPVTGDWLLYTGASGSFMIYNVNDPANPDVVLEEGPDVVAWHEQTVSETLIDGRVILVTAGEVYTGTGNTGAGAPTDEALSPISVIDVTDPTNPEVLSEWNLPITTWTPWMGYKFSPHNIDITPYGQVAVAWYHAGVWVFDVSTQQRQSEPVTLGFFQPHEAPAPMLPETFFQLDHLQVPSVWGGAWTDDGLLVIPDMATGLYVLEPEWGLFPGAG